MTRVDPRSRAAGSLLVLLLAIGCGSEQTSRKTDIGATTPPPTILSFDAAPRSIPAGQPVTLAWTTRNADTIAIADDRGAPVPVEGLAVAAGEVEVFPTTTTVYTLSATGPEGSPGPGSRSVTVTVVPPTAEVPTIESFAASVPEVALGGTVSLSWSTTGATSVTLRDDLGEVVSSAGPAEGSVDVRPVRSPTLYLLTATGPGGRATAQVEVGVVGLPRVHRFLVEPLEPVAAGTTVVLTWETSRADDIRIVDEHEVTVVSTAEAVGRHELVLADTTRFELIASREGVEARAQVLARVGPTIETFSVLPRLARAGDPLLLSWKTAGADTVTISGPGSYRYDVPAAERNEGTTTVALPESGDYVLTALRGTVAKTWAVFAEATRRPLLRSLEADPTTVTAASDLPATVRLSYVQDGGSTCTVRRNNVVVPGLDALPCGRTGTLDVPVTGTADLRLVVRNGDGEDQRSVHVDAVPPARVQSFTKTPARRLGPGGAVTLAWTVTDAVSVGMTKNGLPVAIGAGAFDGTLEDTVESDSVYSLVAENSLGHRTEATLAVLAGSPEIRSFVASSAVAFPGDAVTFHWSCDGGDELLLLDATGTPRATIDRAADIDEGRFTLSVPEAPGDYTYTLQVGNSGGTATATADLHVTDGPLVRAFQASATRLTLGETVDLSWQVTADAANREPELQLVDNFGTAYPLSPADRLAGRVTITPDRPGDFLFTLTASTPDTEPSSARVAVLVAPLPRILQFASTPDVLHTEGAVPPFAASLSWETADAAELELWRTNADGEPIPPSLLRLTAASGQQAQIDAGTLPVELPGTGHFLLQVTSSIGITAERSLEVLVDPAEVLSFVALPPDIITGESSTLAWTTRNATVVALQPLEPIVTETRGTFVDISTDPRAVELALDPADNSWALVVFPDQFRFPFDAELHAGVRVAKNGFLSFDLTGTVASHLNAAFPTNATYRYVHLAPFWDQLQSYLHGKVYWLHDDVAGTLTVMWKDWSYRETSSDWDLDFEVVLHANGSFEYRYGTMFGKARSGTTDKQPIADGDNATIGFQDLTGASGLTLSDGEPVDGGLGNRGWIFDLGLAAAGSRQVTPGASRTYTLTALNPDVRRTASTTITVWGVPSIDTASVYPTTPQVGVPYIVSWQASSATRVRLLDEDGGVLCEETRPASVALGQCELVDPATGPRRYTLEASNGIDRNAVTVPVTFTVFPRLTIDSFAISDPFPSSGDTVTVTWTGTGGFEAELYACTPGTAHADCSRLDIAGQDPNAGSHALVIDRSTEFWFRLVDRLYRATEASALAWVDVPSLDSFTASSLQVAPGESVVLTWASTGNTATLTNFPLGDAVEVTAPYEDISTTGTAASFTSTGGGSYLVEFPDGFAFPYFGESYTALMARGDGWAQFVTNDTAAKATNSALPYKTNSKVHLAPFWDDLSTKTNSRVYFRLVEGAGLRHLVVQWTDFQFATTAANPASLNFQAVLFEDGTIEYRYGTMTSSTTRPGYAQGESATLGLQDPSGTVGKMIGNVHNKAVSGGLASRSWRFPLVPEPSGTVVVTPAESTTYRLCVNNESRYEVCDEIRVVVVSPGDLLVSELMVAPGTAAGEWFEIRNTSPDPIDLAGFLFTSGEYDRYTVPDEGAPVVPPGGFVVLARSDDPAVNGLAAPTLVYGDLLDLSDGEDEVAIGYRGTSIDRVAWTNAWSVPTGASLELEPRMLERSPTGNDDAAAWCAATTPYAAGFLGSPGQLGAGCLDTGVYAHYLVDPTSPLPFLDIGTTGTPLNDIWLAPYHTVPLPLGFAFPYFGEVVTDVTILRDGALAFVPIDGNIPSRNAAMPGSGVPDGLVAPMWDILKNPGTASVRYRLLERDGLRVLVVQWTNTSPSMDDGRYGLVTFQAQLWENGDIVFAYGEPEPVRDLSAADYTLNYGGNSTIGILNLAGDEAIQIFFGDTTRGPKVAYGGRAIHFRAK